MTYNPYQKASQAYQRNTDESLTPLQIVVELYKGMLKFIKLAKKARADGDFELMTHNVTRAFDIIEALQSNIDAEQGGEDAIFLNRFYTVIFSALSQVNMKPDPNAYFDEIIAYVQQVHDRWYVMAYPVPPEGGHSDEVVTG